MIRRRSLIAGLGALFAAPAIIRTPGLLMKVKPVILAPEEFLRDYAGEPIFPAFPPIPIAQSDWTLLTGLPCGKWEQAGIWRRAA